MAEEEEGLTEWETRVIQAVNAWFTENEGLVGIAYEFADQHCHIFDQHSETHKLEYTELHHQFRDLFEQKLNEYLASEELEPEAFHLVLAKAIRVDPEAENMGQMLLAVMDYEFFCQVMVERKNAADEAAAAEGYTAEQAAEGGYAEEQGY